MCIKNITEFQKDCIKDGKEYHPATKRISCYLQTIIYNRETKFVIGDLMVALRLKFNTEIELKCYYLSGGRKVLEVQFISKAPNSCERHTCEGKFERCICRTKHAKIK